MKMGRSPGGTDARARTVHFDGDWRTGRATCCSHHPFDVNLVRMAGDDVVVARAQIHAYLSTLNKGLFRTAIGWALSHRECRSQQNQQSGFHWCLPLLLVVTAIELFKFP